MTKYRNQLKQVMKVRLPYYGTNQCKPTELFITINRTSSVIIKEITRESIDVAIPGERNVIKEEAKKTVTYTDRTTEIQRMWNMKAEVIPVIIGATGNISKSFRQYQSNRPGKGEINL